MDQIANAVFVFPYKKLNIYIKYILDSDKLIRKNLFVVLKMSEELSGLKFLFCLFMLYFVCFIVWYSVIFLLFFAPILL